MYNTYWEHEDITRLQSTIGQLSILKSCIDQPKGANTIGEIQDAIDIVINYCKDAYMCDIRDMISFMIQVYKENNEKFKLIEAERCREYYALHNNIPDNDSDIEVLTRHLLAGFSNFANSEPE
jgi:hypothetical protein